MSIRMARINVGDQWRRIDMSNEPRCDNCGSTSVYRREETFWDTQKKSWSDGGYEFICLDCGQYDVQLEEEFHV